MKYVVDAHTHTLSSGHAYSTVMENAKTAAEKGIKVLAITDHGPGMPGGPHEIHFSNMRSLPRELQGVTILRGCEVNIMDLEGTLDLPEWNLEKLDIIIASLHEICCKPGNRGENTQAVIKTMDNPNIHILGHLGNPFFPIYEEEIVKKAREKDILIEINNGSFYSRPGSEENCTRIARLCREYGVKLVLGSDAHMCSYVGNFSKAEEVLRAADIHEDMIINTDEYKILRYLIAKGRL